MFCINSNISSTMFVSETSQILYHNKILSLYFCFVLEFNMWHRISWIHPRVFCCSIFSFYVVLFRSLFVSFLKAIELYVLHLFSPLTSPNFWTLNCMSFRFTVCVSWLLLRYLIAPLMSSNYPFDFFLITPFLSSDYPYTVSSDCSFDIFWLLFSIFWLPLWYLLISLLLSFYSLFGIFWLPLLYLLITPLVSSDNSSCIFWLPIRYLLIAPLIFPDCSLVSYNFPFCIFW